MRGQKFHSQMSLARRNGCFRSLTCLLFTVCLQIQTRSNHWFIKWVCEDLTRRYPKKLLFPILFRLKHEPEPSSMNPWHPSTPRPTNGSSVSCPGPLSQKVPPPKHTTLLRFLGVRIIRVPPYFLAYWRCKKFLPPCMSAKKILSPEVWEKHSYKISKPNLRSGVFFLSRLPLGYQTKGKKDLLIARLTKSPMHPCKNHWLGH